MQDDLIDYEAAERLTGIRRSTLASMVCRRQIPHYRVGKRIVRFSPRELGEWLAERRVPARAAVAAACDTDAGRAR